MTSEKGSVTVHAIWLATALLVLALVMLEAASLIGVRHRAAAAADLAALAGSRAAVNGHDGCAAARASARANGAELVTCRMDYDVATVTARVVSRRWWGHRWSADVPARAAPDFYFR